MDIRIIACVLLAFVASSAFAKPPPLPISKAEKNKLLDGAVLNEFLFKYNRRTKTGREIVSTFLPKLTDENRKFLESQMSDVDKLPKIVRDGSALIFQFEDGDLRVEWPNFNANQFVIEKTSFVLDPTGPMKFQYENFLKKMNAVAPTSAALDGLHFDFQFLPKANANVAFKVGSKLCEFTRCKVVFTSILGTAAYFNQENVSAGGCTMFQSVKPWTWYVPLCKGWKDAIDEVAAKEAALEEDDDSPLEWGPGGADVKCAKSKDGVVTFEAWMVENRKLPNGDWDERGEWRFVKGKAKKSRFTELYVMPDGKEQSLDPEDADVQFTYTTVGRPTLYSVKLKVPDETGKKPFIWIPYLVVDKDVDVKAQHRIENTRMKMLARNAATLLRNCVQTSRYMKIAPRRTQEALKSMAKQPDSQTTAPTAVPDTPVGR